MPVASSDAPDDRLAVRTTTAFEAWFESRPVLAAVPAALASLVVATAYLLTHPTPALGGGLFLAMAEAVGANGYGLPIRLTGYTPGGIPFAYPPLAFYLLAPLLDAGISPLSLSRFLPALLTVLAVFPTYLLGRELLASNARAGFAALIVATSPAVFNWHLSAGGVVRTIAFLFAVCGLYTGYRAFESGNDESRPRWILSTALLFGLTVLTHPLYPVLFGSGVLYFYLARDRSLRGLLRGVLIAAGGFVLATPWWLTVIARHGPEVLSRTAGSRLGIGQGLVWFPTNFAYLPDTRFLALWQVLVLLGVFWALARRQYVLVGWFAFTALVYPEPRFLLFTGAFLASAFVFEGLLPVLAHTNRNPGHGIASERSIDTTASRSLPSRLTAALSMDSPEASDRRGRVAVLAVICVLGVYGVGTGALYAANYDPISDRPLDRLLTDPMPAYVDSADVAAMRWAERHTASDATFLIAGDAAEWFPLLADRPSIASPWGAEWLPPAQRTQQIERYRAAAECYTARCLSDVLDRPGVNPTYLYVPREGSRSWTARNALSDDQWATLQTSFERSDRYAVVYRNRGVLIVRPRA